MNTSTNDTIKGRTPITTYFQFFSKKSHMARTNRFNCTSTSGDYMDFEKRIRLAQELFASNEHGCCSHNHKTDSSSESDMEEVEIIQTAQDLDEEYSEEFEEFEEVRTGEPMFCDSQCVGNTTKLEI